MHSKTKTLSIEDTNILKSFFTITVLIHHIYQNTAFLRGGAGFLFEALGYLSVAMFFFLSGYGLTSAYKSKGTDYINSLPRRKILPLYIYNLLLIFLYLFLWFAVNQPLSTKRIILSFFFGHTVIKYGWYIQTTLLLYLLFFVVFKTKNKYFKISTLILGYTLYFILCRYLNCWSMWYISVLAFAVGIAFALKPQKINSIICIALFLLTFILGNFSIIGGWLAVLCKMLSATVFPLLIFKLQTSIKSDFPLLRKLSAYTFEIYASQGIFFTLYHSDILYIKSDILYTLFVLASTYIFAILLNKLFKTIK